MLKENAVYLGSLLNEYFAKTLAKSGLGGGGGNFSLTKFDQKSWHIKLKFDKFKFRKKHTKVDFSELNHFLNWCKVLK